MLTIILASLSAGLNIILALTVVYLLVKPDEKDYEIGYLREILRNKEEPEKKETEHAKKGWTITKNVHTLRCRSQYFELIWCGKKTFEVRLNDRNYKVGESVLLKEIIQNGDYTGREIFAKITYILSDEEYVKDGYVILQLSEIMVGYGK